LPVVGVLLHQAGHGPAALVPRDQRRERRDGLVAGGEQAGGGLADRLDGEGREPDRVVRADGVQRVGGGVGAAQRLRDEQRAVRVGVLARPLDEVREVDVGRDEVDGGRA
jgi:hypothetical protein